LNFIQSYKHPETYENVNDLKRIAKNYVFKGWFFIDFVSTFPWGVFVAGGKFTKLLRLLRLPRMIKLIDISRVNKLIKQFLNNDQSRDEKIVAQYMLLYFYKIFRLIIIAIIITYFIGCFWFLLSSTLTEALSKNGHVEGDVFD
jgi:hypothetical protein